MARIPPSILSPRSGRGPRQSNIIIITLLALFQLASLAAAGVVFTNDEYIVHPNEPFTIHWEGNRGPVTITLMRGPDVDLQPVMVIASGLSGNKYTWTPPQTLKTDGYELQIEDGVSTDYSPRFQYPAPPLPSTTLPAPTPTDQTTFHTSTLPATTSSAPTSTSSSSTAASETEGLSTGAKAGIAVGASILGLALLALLGWYIYNRGKKAGAANSQNNNMTEGPAGGGGPGPGYYAPSGTGNFDQDTVIGSSVAGGGGGGYKSPWAASAAARANTPFAELGQGEYTPRELWAGGIYQGGDNMGGGGGSTKGVVNVQERSYSVPLALPIQHPGPVQGGNPPPGYEYDPDQIQQVQSLQQQQQRIQDDWHAVVSPASRSGTGVTTSSNFAGGPPGGFDFGTTSPLSVTSSPAPMGYSATVTAGGPPVVVPSTPPPGLGRYARDASDGSPLSFAARVADEEERGGTPGYGHGRTGSRGASRGGY